MLGAPPALASMPDAVREKVFDRLEETQEKRGGAFGHLMLEPHVTDFRNNELNSTLNK